MRRNKTSVFRIIFNRNILCSKVLSVICNQKYMGSSDEFSHVSLICILIRNNGKNLKNSICPYALSNPYYISFLAIYHHSQDSDKNSDASCLMMLFILAKIWPEIHLMSLKAIFIIFIMVTKMVIFDYLNL